MLESRRTRPRPTGRALPQSLEQQGAPERRKTHIGSAPHVPGWKPIVFGARLAVGFLLGLFGEGRNEKQVLDNHLSSTRDALKAVFAFAAESLSDDLLYPMAG